MEDIYSMELHDIMYVGSSMYCRVPGGWVYSYSMGVCFIPYNNEFDVRPPNEPLHADHEQSTENHPPLCPHGNATNGLCDQCGR